MAEETLQQAGAQSGLLVLLGIGSRLQLLAMCWVSLMEHCVCKGCIA